MDYISAKEAAEKWQVGLRIVQQYCKNNRIPGVRKYGNSWMIPEDAKKPEDPRKEQKLDQNHSRVMMYTTISISKRNPSATLGSLTGETRDLAFADLEYRRGNCEPALTLWKNTREDSEIKLSAGSLATAAAISSGNYAVYEEIKLYFKNHSDQAKTAEERALLSLPDTLAIVSMTLPSMTPEWLKNCDFSLFPQKLRPYLLYLHSLHLRNIGDFWGMLATAQATLVLCESQDTFTWLDIYLYVMCACAAYALNQPEKSLRYLERAVEIGIPYGYLAPFADYLGALGGIIDTALQPYPKELKEIRRLWGCSSKNWIQLHNTFARENITTLLKPQEYQVAHMLAHGATYAQVADRMHLSVSRVKYILSNVYATLLIERKQELKKFIL